MTTPEQLIADARGYASEVAGNAQRALSEAQARIGAVGYIIPNPEEVDVGDIQGPDGLPDAPGVADVLSQRISPDGSRNRYSHS